MIGYKFTQAAYGNSIKSLQFINLIKANSQNGSNKHFSVVCCLLFFFLWLLKKTHIYIMDHIW